MKKHGWKGGVAAVALLVAAGAAEASQAVLTLQNSTPVSLALVSQSCIGSPTLPWPETIAAGDSVTVTVISTLTSNGCQVTYRRSDTSASCRYVATRLESGLPPAPWNFPTVNITKSGTITCSDTITSVSTNGDWAATLTIAP